MADYSVFDTGLIVHDESVVRAPGIVIAANTVRLAWVDCAGEAVEVHQMLTQARAIARDIGNRLSPHLYDSAVGALRSHALFDTTADHVPPPERFYIKRDGLRMGSALYASRGVAVLVARMLYRRDGEHIALTAMNPRGWEGGETPEPTQWVDGAATPVPSGAALQQVQTVGEVLEQFRSGVTGMAVGLDWGALSDRTGLFPVSSASGAIRGTRSWEVLNEGTTVFSIEPGQAPTQVNFAGLRDLAHQGDLVAAALLAMHALGVKARHEAEAGHSGSRVQRLQKARRKNKPRILDLGV